MQWWIFQAESDASLLRLVCLVEFVFKYSTKIRNGQSANPCQLASRSVFMPTPRVSATSSRPSIHIIFQQTGQFVGPNPLQYKGHNGAYSGWLSSLDLLLPLGLPSFPSFPDRRECLDRQILVAKHVKTGVCAVRPHTSVQTWTHTHPQALWRFIRVHCFQHWGCWGKILAVTLHAHWGTLMGPTQRGLGWKH